MADYNERRPIEGFPNYEVDAEGNVYSVTHKVVARFKDGRTMVKQYQGKKLKPCVNEWGYLVVVIKDATGKWYTRQVHRLVALAFIPNPDNLPVVNHKDENRTNNRVDNLEWCTNEYNLMYGTAEDRRREKLKGRDVWNKQPVIGKKIESDRWMVYPSQTKAAEVLGIPVDGISYVSRGLRDSTCGYVFERIDPSEVKYYAQYTQE